MVLDANPRVRRGQACFGIALVHCVAVGIWAWTDASSPQTVFPYGTPSYYALGVAFVTLLILGFSVLAGVEREQPGRPSAVFLAVSSTLLLVPLGIYLVAEIVVLGSALTGGF